MSNILSVEHFPALATIVNSWKDIKEEYLSIQHLAEQWPPRAFRGTVVDGPDGIVTNNNGYWDYLPLFIDGKYFVTDDVCSKTISLIKNIPDLFLAGFSILRPGCEIFPHHGPLDPAVYKMHLGLICPHGAWIDIAGDRYYWQDGEAMVFDDTLEHFALNPTQETRVIFMVDVLKHGYSISTY